MEAAFASSAVGTRRPEEVISCEIREASISGTISGHF
jgi:hypothetical protein